MSWVGGGGNASSAIKVPHRSPFDPEAVKRQLGITVSSWDGFVTHMKALVERPVDPDTVESILRRVRINEKAPALA